MEVALTWKEQHMQREEDRRKEPESFRKQSHTLALSHHSP